MHQSEIQKLSVLYPNITDSDCLLVSQAALREGYLEDTVRLIRRQDVRSLSSLEEAQAAGRRLEALATDVLAREPRFSALRDMAKAIERGNYHSKEQVIRRSETSQTLKQILKRR